MKGQSVYLRGPRGSDAVCRVRLDAEQSDFVAASSLLFVMSGAPGSAPDVSPRGDAPGFVRVLDGCRLQLPDRVGNNRIDTIRNVLQDPRMAMVFVCPGDSRVLTITGTGIIRTDPELLMAFVVGGRSPRSILELAVHTAHLGFSRAFDLSGLWRPDTDHVGANFSLGAALAEQMGGKTSVKDAERLVAENYKSELY